MSQVIKSNSTSKSNGANGTNGVDYGSLMKKALVELREAKAKLKALENRASEAIAIVGMGCRFPGGVTSPDAFWQLLSQGVDAISEVPANRWDVDEVYDPNPDTLGKVVTRYGGFIDEIETFDANFFGISPREAHSLDPQQRMLLEVAWEALEAAQCPPEKLFNTQTGVFIGICNNDYGNRLGATALPEAYWGTGNALSVAAGRLSYALGLTGPSLAVDTACSSSLVSVHLACQSLRQGECTVALAGGVNLLLSPGQSMIFSQAGMLAPDGRCKTFDANANGYVRGEGCGVLVLKRLSDAQRNGDTILATIRGSAVNQDGPSGGLTVPNGPSQQTVIRQALKQGNVKPDQVSYIEAHGTGTSLGDPIEVSALGEVFKNHDHDSPLLIGSAKTNIGHLEGAAGVAGLMKVVLQLQHRQIPPHLHFNEPNPFIDWDGLPVKVANDSTDWQPSQETRIAGVSSFGFGGTNCHIVLEEAIETVSVDTNKDTPNRPLQILSLSAKSPKALQTLAADYSRYINQGDLDLADLCAAANIGRSQFNHRLAILTKNIDELLQTLTAVQSGEASDLPGVITGHVKGNRVPKVVFLFTGQGAQYINMGRELYQTEPVFRKSLDRCAESLDKILDVPLLELLYPESGRSKSVAERIHQTAYAQPCLFAVEYALAQLWFSWGVKPSMVMGHSVGEYVAATLAGVFSLEDGLQLIAERGRLMQSLPSGGGMLSVLASEDTLKSYLNEVKSTSASHSPRAIEIAIAAINGPESTVVSGPLGSIDLLAEKLIQAGFKVKHLTVSHGFHSPMMEPILGKFKAFAQQITFNAPSLKLVSNVTGKIADDGIASADYWTNHIRRSVQFVQGVETLASSNIDTFIEVGPKPVLLGMARQFVADGTWLPSMQPKMADAQGTEYYPLFNSLAQLHGAGYPVAWKTIYTQKVSLPYPLPTYPFQRKRFWVDPVSLTGQQPTVVADCSILEEPEDSEKETNTFPLLQQLGDVAVADRNNLLTTNLRTQVARIMGMDSPDEVDIYQSLTELGLDSLMGVELKNRLESALNLSLPTTILFQYSDIDSLSRHLISEYLSAETLDLTGATAAGDHGIPLADRSQPIPLSYAQQRMWVLAQLEALDSAYHLPAAIKFTGELNYDALEQSLNLIVKRHESLRTVFITGANGEPEQQIKDSVEISLPIADLQNLDPTNQTQEFERLLNENDAAFDLATGPLFRLNLIYLQPQEHILLLNFHHIVFDGWSSGVLIQEFRQLYSALVQGEAPQLPAISVQYADFVQWQRQQLQGDMLSGHLNYWTQQLADAPPLLELPTDRPRPAVQTVNGAILNQSLPLELSQKLRQLSQSAGKTLYMTLLTGFTILLHRYSGQTDISVGSPIANRPHQQVEGLMGLFLNTLVLRTDVSGNPTIEELLNRVEEVALGAYDHQDVPFEYLIDQLKPERHMDHSLWFQVMFILQNTPQQSLGATDVEMSYVEIKKAVSKFDITLSAEEHDAGLQVEWEYNTDLFDASTIERMAGHYERVLTSMVADLQQSVATLPLLSAEEQTALLTLPESEIVVAPETTIHRLIEARVEQMPDAVALRHENTILTYTELNQQANQLAHYLIELGVKPDTLMGLCVERSPQMMIAVLGILKAGAAYVPLDPTYPQERIDYIVADAAIDIVVTTNNLETVINGNVQRVYLNTQWETIAQQPTENPQVTVTADHLAYAIYTSGSTGKPKGVLIEHGSLVNFVQGAIQDYGFTAKDRVLQFASISFDTAAEEIYPTLVSGATLVLRNDDSVAGLSRLVDQCEQWGLTVLDLPTAYWQQLVVECDRTQQTFPAPLRLIIIGGEKVSVESVRLWQQLGQDSTLRLLNTYGPTETTVVATLYEIPNSSVESTMVQEIPIGKPLPNVFTCVLDAQQQPVPVGVPGELYIGGPGVARGYLKQLEKTAANFIPNPLILSALQRTQGDLPLSPFTTHHSPVLYKTGDRVRLLADGNLEYLGRLDHQVKIRGFRIELGEIETQLSSHSAIEDTLVTVIEPQPGNKQLVAYCVASDNIAQSELRAHLQTRVPEYMVPSVFMLLEQFPLTTNGKVDRKALPLPEQTDMRQGQDYVAPRNATEAAIAFIVAEVLGLERVGIHDNFFEIGGHSLLATQVIARVQDMLSVTVPLKGLFEQPTVAGLAALTDQATQSNTGVETTAGLSSIKRDQPLPLSYAQQRMWVLNQLETHNSAYHLPAAVRLLGPLDVIALTQSFQAIVMRHESLRTSFINQNGEPVQVIHSRLDDLPIATRDLDGLSEVEQQQWLETLITQNRDEPFDLVAGPLFRLCLVRLDETSHVLLLNFHHIIFDGWSVGILIQEFRLFYQAFAQGQTPQLPKLTVQYADYAHWQRQQLQGEKLESHLTYWRKQLRDMPSLLELPTDRPRPAVQTVNGAACIQTLPVALTDQLRGLAKRNNATLFMVLLTGFNVLLHRYSGQDDIAVGSPIANRPNPQLEGLLGMFLNTLVLRNDLSGQPTVEELLSRVKTTALDAYRYQDVPFEVLIDELKPERHMDHSLWFQVMFILQNTPQQSLGADRLEMSFMEAEKTVSKFDITLSVEDRDTGLQVEWEYNTNLFDASTIERMAQHYETLLHGMVANPQQSIATLPLMSEAEQTSLLSLPESDIAISTTDAIHSLIEAQVKQSPDAVAVQWEGATLTYAELNRQANQLANYLIGLGVQPNTLVGLCVDRSPQMIVAVLGILKAGAAYVPLDPTYPQERIDYIVDDANVDVLVTTENLKAVIGVKVQPVYLDTQWETIAQQSTENPDVVVTGQNLAYAIYTSGSTGKPKGVLIEHGALVNFTQGAIQDYGFTAEDRVLQFASISFDTAAEEVYPTLVSGATLVLRNDASVAGLSRLVSQCDQWKLTVLDLPTAYWQQLVAECVRTQQRFPDLRLVIIGGEKVSVESVRLWQQLDLNNAPRLLNTYGPTETTVVATFYEIPNSSVDEMLGQEVPIGKPLPNVFTCVLDTQQQPVPVGIPGELYIGGLGVARGYLNQTEKTAASFIDSPFGSGRLYKTGDRVKLLPDGNLEYLGRLDHQVKIRGFRIELGEIEAQLASHNLIEEAIVISREDQPGRPQLVGYVVALPNSNVDPVELKSYLKDRLPHYMVPDVVIVLDALPLNANGKVDRKALPAPQTGDLLKDQEYVAPCTETETELVAIVAEVLGLDRVGVDDNFFEIGGHSLLATQVIARVQDMFHVDIALRSLFERPTVAVLAEQIEQQQLAGADDLDALLNELEGLSDDDIAGLLT